MADRLIEFLRLLVDFFTGLGELSYCLSMDLKENLARLSKLIRDEIETWQMLEHDDPLDAL